MSGRNPPALEGGKPRRVAAWRFSLMGGYLAGDSTWWRSWAELSGFGGCGLVDTIYEAILCKSSRPSS